MDNLLSILVVVIFYLLVVSGGKKKAKNERHRAPRMRETVFEQAFSEGKSEPVQGTASHASRMFSRHEACAAERIHLHEATQQEMISSAEGEDPCHYGSAQAADAGCTDETFSYDKQETENSAFAQDILRGVIMSEILTRPCMRTAARQSGRCTK